MKAKLAAFVMGLFESLQFFADAGSMTNVAFATDSNGDDSYQVNSYTGQVETYSSANDFAPELKDYYNTKMLENYRMQQRYVQLGKPEHLPARHGTTMEFRKWNTFARAGRLQDGVIPTGQKWGATAQVANIDQYGTYVTLSDRLKRHSFDDATRGAYEEMGASAAETEEILTRDALYVNTNVMYCDNVDANGAIVSTPTMPGKMAWDGSAGYSKLTPTMVNKAKTKMVKDKVKPMPDGKFVAVIHPSVAFDLREDPHWIEAHKYAAVTQIFNGEIGELHGVRFIEDVHAPVFSGADLASDTRTLAINNADGYSGAITSVAFDGSAAGVAADALIGRTIMINGITAVVTDNTTTAITFASTNFGSIADNTVIYPGEGAGAGRAAYATYFFGNEPFVRIDAEGGALQMITHDQHEIGGPLDQFSTIGYKLDTNGATVLYTERVLRVMSGSSYGDVDEKN